MQNEANWTILNSFDITSQSGHNSLIRVPIEMIKDAMEHQEKSLQLPCFEF